MLWPWWRIFRLLCEHDRTHGHLPHARSLAAGGTLSHHPSLPMPFREGSLTEAHYLAASQAVGLQEASGSFTGTASQAPQPTLWGLRLNELGHDYIMWRPVIAEMLHIPLDALPIGPNEKGFLPSTKVGQQSSAQDVVPSS